MAGQTVISAAARSGARRGRALGRIGPAARWIAFAGFAAAGPLVVIAPKALWLVGVLIAIARLVALAPDPGPALRALWRDLARLRLLWLVAALGLASALWAVVPDHSLERGLRLVLELAVGAVMLGLAVAADTADAGRYLRAAAAGLIAALPLAAADIELDGALLRWAHNESTAIFAYGRAAALSAILAVPLAVLLWQHRARAWSAAILVVAVGFVLVAANETAKLSLLFAAAGALLAVSRWTRPLPALAFAASLLLIPLLVPQPMNGPFGCWLMAQKASIVHRLGIWNFVDGAAAERPLLGWGLEGARQIPGGTMQLAMPDCGPGLGPDTFGPRIAERLPLHPHGFVLNTWLELGAVGAFVLLLAFLDLARGFARLPRARAWAACAAISVVFLPASVSFGMWQGWWITSLFLLAALCLLAPARKPVPAPV